MDEYFELLKKEMDYVLSAVSESESFSLTCGENDSDASTLDTASTIEL